MASQKPVWQKLFIKEGNKVLIMNQPEDYENLLGEIPENVTISATPIGAFNLILFFVSSREVLEEKLRFLKECCMVEGGLLWVTYPKGTSKIKADINRDSIAEYAASIGFRAVAMVSIDDTWSALRLKVE